MYTFFKRSLPEPNLVAFDCSDASAAAVQRSASNTPLQALTTLNQEVFFEAAQAMARRVLQSTLRTDEERVAFAFRLALARRPTEREQAGYSACCDGRTWYQNQEQEAAHRRANRLEGRRRDRGLGCHSERFAQPRSFHHAGVSMHPSCQRVVLRREFSPAWPAAAGSWRSGTACQGASPTDGCPIRPIRIHWISSPPHFAR